jgi:hypothetical protein
VWILKLSANAMFTIPDRFEGIETIEKIGYWTLGTIIEEPRAILPRFKLIGFINMRQFTDAQNIQNSSRFNM